MSKGKGKGKETPEMYEAFLMGAAQTLGGFRNLIADIEDDIRYQARQALAAGLTPDRVAAASGLPIEEVTAAEPGSDRV